MSALHLRAGGALLGCMIGALLLSGCAGGGGGGSPGVPVSPPVSPPASPPPPVGPPPPLGPYPSASSAEYNANWAVGATHASAAWERGITGRGVTIGVIDDGIDPTHPELTGRVSSASIDIVTERSALNTELSHGSELASLMAGNFNGVQTVGLAYGATILAVRADDGDSFPYSNLANALDYAVANNVDVVNFSLGSSFSGEGTPGGDAFKAALANATAAGVIVVVSAGNDGGSRGNAQQVNYPGFFATDPNISHGLIVVAGGTNKDGSFNDISNPAGAAASAYIIAPGWEIVVPDHGPAGPVPGYQTCSAGLCTIQGTSYASPQVTAAAALLMEAFPALTPAQIVELIFSSADDYGPAGIDAQTGHGKLNIARAFQPQGLSAPVNARGGDVFAGAPVGVAGAAFGDAFARPQAWRSVGFDRFGRTFNYSLASNWRAAPQPGLAGAPLLWRRAEGGANLSTSFAQTVAPPAAARIWGEAPKAAFRTEAALGEGLKLSVASGVPAFADPRDPEPYGGHLGFAGVDQGAALTRTLPAGRFSLMAQSSRDALAPGFSASERAAAAARFDFSRGPLRWGVSAGGLREDGGVLGLGWDQRWGAAPRAATWFAGISSGFSVRPGVEIGFDAETGRTDLIRSGWLGADGAILTTSAAAALRVGGAPEFLQALAPGSEGVLTLSVSQPLRVERGAFLADLATADAYGISSLEFVERRIEAAPMGREIATRLGYAWFASDQFSARLELSHRSQPGHSASAPNALGLALGVRYGF